MTTSLSLLDHCVIATYLIAMLGLGYLLSRRQRTTEEYFLAARGMPWFAVGISVIASLLSSLTYLSEPGEVWKSGVTHVLGKMLAIPLEMAIVWIFCVPFMMSFRYTSAYEYLGDRFGSVARKLGAVLFIVMVVLWMGFVVLASAKALAQVSGVPLWLVIGTIGVVATFYTMLGGLRAVIWTDVIQVVILIGGGLYVIGSVSWATGTFLPEWYATANDYLTRTGQSEPMPWFSFDPTVRTTILTVAINMCVWHVCTHVANQMTVQRYFSTSDARAARKSFVTGSLFGVGLNLMLMTVGLAVLYYYVGQGIALDEGLNTGKGADLIFPTFAVNRLPDGVGGFILAALLAAAMSSIDSGVNSIATVVSVELRRQDDSTTGEGGNESFQLHRARGITFGAGLFITVAAFSLTFLPENWGIVAAMPRTFNAVTAPLGGLFLVGMFLPRVGEKAVIAGTFCGLATSLLLGYSQQLGEWLGLAIPEFSFTWIMPSALTVTCCGSYLFSLFQPDLPRDLEHLTWGTRRH